ncbi:MAG: peptidylprolyl isomerase [Kofleriaceae bacterium]
MRALAIIVAIILAIIVGCGSPRSVETRQGPPAPLVAPAASPDDVVVATVNGKPVWGSCVTVQARRGATKHAALEQCIDFELLAQRAVGHAGDAEVRLATHTAMVSALVAGAYEDGYTQPGQFGAFWTTAYKKGVFHYRHENYRASAYVRVVVPAGASGAVEADAKAKAERIAAAVAPETGLLGSSLLALAQAAAPGTKLDHEEVPAYREGALDDHYAKALFALTQIGRATGAVRTKWGWDVIVWTDDVPAADPPEADITAALLPDIKIAYFGRWVDGIARSLGVRVTLDKDNIAKLEDLP